MSDREILDAITTALERFAPKKARALREANANLEQLTLSALGLDSIAMLELIGAVETSTAVTFDDHELVRIDNVESLVRLIQFKQGAKP